MKKYFLLIPFLILLIILSLFLFNNNTLGSQEIFTEIIIGENPGIKVDTDALYFGKTVPGGSAKRNLILENTYPFDVNVFFIIEGNISEMLWAEDNPAELLVNSTIGIPFYVVVPFNTSLGTYNGTINAVFKRR